MSNTPELDIDYTLTIFEALDNAYENNPEIVTWTNSDLAVDMNRFCGPLEGWSNDELIPYIDAWRVQFAGRP